MIPKFRAWHIVYEEMLPVLAIDFVNEEIQVLPDRNLEGGNVEVWKLRHIDLMQYIGVHDKNEKELCQGDIYIDERGEKRVVSYEQKHYNREWEPIGYHLPYSLLEIIGTTYENPELLKSEAL
jgi:uncharacterized phage protein (TIGR01671 family)